MVYPFRKQWYADVDDMTKMDKFIPETLYSLYSRNSEDICHRNMLQTTTNLTSLSTGCPLQQSSARFKSKENKKGKSKKKKNSNGKDDKCTLNES